MENYQDYQAQMPAKQHSLTVTNRQSIEITGVVDVVSFDAQEIILETEGGLLLIRGTQLHMNRLTVEKGEVSVDGNIDGLTYSDQPGSKKNTHMFGRLFG